MFIKNINVIFLIVLLCCIPVIEARPHKPSIIETNTISNSVFLDDIDISQVFYLIESDFAPGILELWLEFEIECEEQCDDLFLQTGIPKSPPATSNPSLRYEILKKSDI